MARVIFLEVLDARGQLRTRVRLDAFPATIGRSYDNDVILDDPFVCPHHARVHVDGERAVVVEDLGSVNGVHAASRSGRQSMISVLAGESVRLGRTTLRVCEVGQTVAPALIDREQAGARLPRVYTPRASVAALAVAFLVLSAQSYFGSFERVGVARIVSDALPALALLALWAGAWALASRIASHRSNFLPHLALAASVVAAGIALGTAHEWLVFLFPAEDGLDVVLGIVYLALAVLLLHGHLSLASSVPRRKRWIAALSVTATLFAVITIIGMAEDEEFSTALEYRGVLKPVSGRWVRSVSIDEFSTASERLRAAVDSLADE